MKEYDVIYYSRAEKDLSKINKKEAKVIYQKISQLKFDPHPQMSIKLKGYEYHRLRVGNYRAIYQIDETNNKVIVITIKHRSEVYLGL
jgi:mRNA interferase RelE/StbE